MALRRLVAACTVAARTEHGEPKQDPAVQQATRDFIRRMHAEVERGEGLNVTIGAGLGALRVFEKALREGRGGTDVREGLLALCAGFFPILPTTARDAAQRIVPGWEANAVGLPRTLAAAPTPRRTSSADFPGASSDAPPDGITDGLAADGASSHTLVVQVNGRFVQACEAPGFGTQEEAVAWAFSHCEALERRVTREEVNAVHWKPGRVLNLVRRTSAPSPVPSVPAPRPRRP